MDPAVVRGAVINLSPCFGGGLNLIVDEPAPVRRESQQPVPIHIAERTIDRREYAVQGIDETKFTTAPRDGG